MRPNASRLKRLGTLLITTCILSSAAYTVSADSRLTVGPLPATLIKAEQCISIGPDGWGWDGFNTCTPPAVDPNCNYSDSALGYNLGWGYNPITRASCPPAPNTSTYVPEDKCNNIHPVTGWGWNPNRQINCPVGR